MTPFGTLVRKDWRVYRPAVVAGVLLAPVPGLFAWSSASLRNDDLYAMLLTLHNVRDLVLLTVAAMFGGFAFAAERRDGSSDFLAVLPPHKGAMLLSKLLVAAGCLLGFMCLLYACGQAVLAIAEPANPGNAPITGSIGRSLRQWTSGLVPLTFAVGLLCSLVAKGPAVASACAVVGTILLMTLAEAFVRPLLVVVSAEMRSSPELRGTVFRAMPGALAFVIFGLTLLLYARRKTA
jgi:ABC-type transport system involved in multi-copper enzyme maturation permease subunit